MNSNIFRCNNCNSEEIKVFSNKISCRKCNKKYLILNNIPCFLDSGIAYKNKSIWDNRATIQSKEDVVTPINNDGHNVNASLARLELEKEIIPKISGSSILEIGCGKGQFLKVLEKAGRFSNIFGADYSFEMLMNCSNRFSRINCDARKLPIKDKSIDIVIFVTVLMHNKDISEMISEAQRVSKKFIVIQECTGIKIPKILRKNYVFPRSVKSYRNMFEKNGWKMVYHKERRGLPLKYSLMGLTGLSFALSKQSWMVFKKNDR